MSGIEAMLPWLNVLFLPGMMYIIRLERRILTLELTIHHALAKHGYFVHDVVDKPA